MTFLGRDPLTAQLIKAFGLKSMPTDFSSTVIPQVSALDLENSPWPPSIPFVKTQTSVATALNRSLVQIGLVSTAPPQSRLVIDFIEINSGETSGLVRSAIGNINDNSTLTSIGPAQRLDNSDLTASQMFGGNPINDIQVSESHGTVGPQLHANAQLFVSANVAKIYNPIDEPLAIIVPGGAFAIENNTVDLILTVTFRGRYFVGQ